MNIYGIILNGQYKNYQIVSVITTELIDWDSTSSIKLDIS